MAAFELKADFPELTYYEIGRKIGADGWSVHRWLNDEAFFYPWVDDIAVRRAFEGDRQAYESLTYWERRDFFRMLADTRRGMRHWDWRYHCRDLAQLLGITGVYLGGVLRRMEGSWFTEDNPLPAMPAPRGKAGFRRAGYQMASRPWE